MTWIFQKTSTPNDAVNLAPTTGAEAVFFIKQALKQAGWVVKSSSDGSTYNSSADQITTGASGAGGMANNSAWFRIQAPDGGVEMTVQRGTTGNTVWRVKWSHSAKFTGGTPGTTQTPSATDEKIVAGGGTDASPTFLTWLAADAGYKLHIGTDNAAPYSFHAFTLANGGAGNTRRIWFVNMAAASYPSGDVAPYVVEVSTTGAVLSSLNTVTVNTACFGQGFYKKGLAGETWVGFRAGSIVGSSTAVPNQLGANPYDGDDNTVPIPVFRILTTDTQNGWKGFVPQSHMAWKTLARNNLDTTDIGGNRYVYLDDIAVRFANGVTPTA